MIDLNELNEKLGGLTGGQGSAEGLGEVLGPGTPTELLGQIGIDPADLANMAPGDIMTMLSENGVDLSQFTETDVQGLMEQFIGENADLANMAQEAVQNGGLGEMVQNVLGRFIGR